MIIIRMNYEVKKEKKENTRTKTEKYNLKIKNFESQVNTFFFFFSSAGVFSAGS